MLEGEHTFRFGQDGAARTLIARRGDAVSVPVGVATPPASPAPSSSRADPQPARCDRAFFADAGEPFMHVTLPSEPPPFDRDRLHAAFAKHGATTHRG